MVLCLVTPLGSAKGLWGQGSGFGHAHLQAVLLLSCVGACLTLAVCLKSVLEMLLGCFLN